MENEWFFQKDGFEKCILNQIELIRHWNKNTNFITTCLNFKLKLTEHIRSRNSIFVGLVHTSAYWLKDYVSEFMIQKRKTKISKTS